jgi:NAD(P)-dependent dehydrogenase (short-subunit alcohol dehydrogenase family)
LRAKGVRASAIQADQADPAAAAAVVREVADEFGRLDILVNNAAIAVLGLVDSPASDDAALDRQVRVKGTRQRRPPHVELFASRDGAATSSQDAARAASWRP